MRIVTKKQFLQTYTKTVNFGASSDAYSAINRSLIHGGKKVSS